MVSSSTDMPVRVSECSLTYATIESFTSFAIVVVLYLVIFGSCLNSGLMENYELLMVPLAIRFY